MTLLYNILGLFDTVSVQAIESIQISANGVACETYHDVGNRSDFDNSQEYWDLYPGALGHSKEGRAFYLTDSSIRAVYKTLVDRAAKIDQPIERPKRCLYEKITTESPASEPSSSAVFQKDDPSFSVSRSAQRN